MKKNILILLFLFFTGITLIGQRERIELIGADELEGVTFKGQKANLLNGNVRVKHSGSLMACNKAYMYTAKNNFDAFGNVSIKQDNGLTIYGDSLFYNGDTKIAKIRGNVRVIDKNMTLNTRMLDYNMQQKTAWYYGGGTILDRGTRLESKNGFFDTKQDFYTFKGDVNVYKDNYHIVADTLKYAASAQKAYFYGPTHIYSKEKTLYAESGLFNTKENKAWFNQNAWVETPTYKLFGDSLYFDNNSDYGYAIDNVRIESFKDQATIFGDVAISDGPNHLSKIYGNAFLLDYSSEDTTYILADTLISIDDTAKSKKVVEAINNVKVIKGELSGISEYMLYNTSDSAITFKKDPILWNGGTQIVGDSIKILMKNGKVNRMLVYKNAFIISQNETDTSKYMQVKGTNMVAYFDDNNLTQLDVDGNGESIYYAYNEEKEYIGMNKVICGNMKMYIVDNNMNMVKFYNRPIANFIPPQLVTTELERLADFDWQTSKKPKINEIMAQSANRKPIERNNIVEITNTKIEETEAEESLSRKERRKLKKENKK